MSEKKNPIPTADPPKPTLLQRVIALCDPDLGEADFLDWVRMGGTPESFINMKARARADVERQRRIDSGTDPEFAEPRRAPNPDEVAKLAEIKSRATACPGFPLPPGVAWEAIAKKLKSGRTSGLLAVNGRWIQPIIATVLGGHPLSDSPTGTVDIYFNREAPQPDTLWWVKAVADELAGLTENAERNRQWAEQRDELARERRTAALSDPRETLEFG